MNRSLYTSAVGMMTQMNNMQVITNNIANVDTTGYKSDTSVVQSFSEELFKRLDDPTESLVSQLDSSIGGMSLGNFVTEISTNFTNGAFKETGGTYDLALEGSGFFCLEVTDNYGNTSEKYTRDGSFTANANGELVTKEGNYVLGQNGVITIPNGNVTISENGYIYSNGEFVDVIKMVDFENKETLRKTADNIYETIAESVEEPATCTILQRHLEASNVNIVTEMVKMISVSRIYEMGSKLVETQDSILGKAVSDIARK